MFTKRWNITSWVLVCAVLLSLLLTNSVIAQSPTGGGPDEAMTPDSGWKEIQSGQQHWYRFHFTYDEKWSDRPVEIRLYSEPSEGAVLTIRNEEQVQRWRSEGKNEHFGCCTLFDIDKDNNGTKDYALWSGVLSSTDDYFIVVEHARNITQPVRYRFELSGSGLSFPGVVTQPAAAPIVPPPAIRERVLGSLTGTGPDFAMAPTGEWKELKQGEHHWYAFNFGYDEKRENPTIEIKLWSEPYNGAMLSLRNEEQANRWRKDGKHEWFGCTTPANVDRDYNGNPDYGLWAGTLRISGRYYMVVEHSKEFSQPVYYRFSISGGGVSFPSVTAAPAAAPQAVAAEIVSTSRTPTGLTGTGPDYAMRPTSEWTTIGDGEVQWYAFHFGYDEKLADRPVTIRIYTEPNEGAVLTVRNADQADLWRREGKHEHFGCCTPFFEDKDKDGRSDYALWSGKLYESGTYYIVVEHARNISGPVHYSFVIEGPGVSF